MDLETFVAESLRQIITGIQAAQQSPDCQEARINPATLKNKKARREVYLQETPRLIEFDVALTVTEDKEKKAGVGVIAGAFGVGGQAQSTTSNTSVSRVKFSVPVVFPQLP
ncbi:MAG: hypothetical protein JW809_14640 [Pirellulales bacterium]|nr:hypothetical protein [Pirellulales bacterium]